MKEILLCISVGIALVSLFVISISIAGSQLKNTIGDIKMIDYYCYELEHDGQTYIVNIKGGIVKK